VPSPNWVSRSIEIEQYEPLSPISHAIVRGRDDKHKLIGQPDCIGRSDQNPGILRRMKIQLVAGVSGREHQKQFLDDDRPWFVMILSWTGRLVPIVSLLDLSRL
jgi:hypothetical protein